VPAGAFFAIARELEILGPVEREPSSAEARDCIKQTAWGPTYTKHIT
jgi:hypothetical protein